MKRFLFLFVALGAALLSMPGILGFQVQESYQTLIQGIQGGGLQVSSQTYRRDWFGATARTEFYLPLPESPDQASPTSQGLRFTLVSQINHGPLTTAGAGLADLSSHILLEDTPLFPADAGARIETAIGLDGAGSVSLQLPATEVAADGKRPKIGFAGLQGELTFDSGFDALDARFDLAGISAAQDGAWSMDLGRMALLSRTNQGADGLRLGEGSLTLERLRLDEATGSAGLDLGGLSMDVVTSARDSVVDGEVSYRLDKAIVDGRKYGPVSLKLTMANMSSRFLASIQAAAEEANARRLTQEERGLAVMNQLISGAPDLLKQDPRISLEELSLETPDGLVRGSFTIQALGLRWEEIGDLPRVLNKLVAEASISMPEPLLRLLFVEKAEAEIRQQVEQRKLMGEPVKMPEPEKLRELALQLADQQIDQLIRQEFLLARDGYLATDASLSDGLLSVNGKMIPIPGQP